jgi:hypothetical protein
MKTNNIIISVIVVGAGGFFLWRYLKKRRNKKIAQCMTPDGLGGGITLESVIASLPKFEKGEAKDWEMERYNKCKESIK